MGFFLQGHLVQTFNASRLLTNNCVEHTLVIMQAAFDEKTKKIIELAQKIEITEYHIYVRLAKSIKNEENRKILERIADDELEHAEFWKKYTGKDIKPSRRKVFQFFWIARLFGLTFGIKLLEKGEELAQKHYKTLEEAVPEVKKIEAEEEEHEQTLIGMIEEEALQYVGSVVLGLNDALVELTGALAGLSFALQNTRLIALAGLITGIAASFSMAASEYLSTKAEETDRHAVKSSLYTGFAYIVTVMLLIVPYLLVGNYLVCLALTMTIAITIILVFNYYISVAQDLSFRRRFLEMAGISLGVSLLSFGIGYIIRIFLGVEV